jgi:hypothetical protein
MNDEARQRRDRVDSACWSMSFGHNQKKNFRLAIRCYVAQGAGIPVGIVGFRAECGRKSREWTTVKGDSEYVENGQVPVWRFQCHCLG